MYESYLNYHHIPCGAVIERILKKGHLTQRELAIRSGIPYQRINDFIANRRRVSPENSLKLEKALGVDYQCFFYQIQTNNDIFVAINRMSVPQHPDLSKYRKALFWDTDFDTIDWQHNEDWVIRRVFEYGNEAEIKETVRYYGRPLINDVLTAIHDSWNTEIRKQNITKYLDDDVKN